MTRTLYISAAVLLGALSFGAIALATTDDMVIERPEPREAVVNTPTLFWVTAEDPDGVASCTWVVSAKDRDEMTYNATLDRWEILYTFDELRTANSIRARCFDALGNETLGSPRVIPVLEIDLTSNDGDPAPPDSEPAEVDATGFTEAEVIAASPVLIKTVCPGGEDVNHPCRTVYFLDHNGARHAFPNERAYFTWYTDFINIHLITNQQMADFPLGRNVRYHPAKRLVKFPSLNTVYAVARNGVLRPIASEAAAAALYGNNWNQQVDDISEVFYMNYTFGDPIDHVSQFVRTTEEESVSSINDNL